MPRDSAYGDIWRDVVPSEERRAISHNTGYSPSEVLQAHIEVFLSLPVEHDTREERLQAWADYLDVMVVGGYTREARENFFMDLGIDPRDFDWEAWRAAMGYERANA